jgi:hypothetical protein
VVRRRVNHGVIDQDEIVAVIPHVEGRFWKVVKLAGDREIKVG